MNEKIQTRIFFAIGLLLLVLSVFILGAGGYMYFRLEKLGSELPVRTVSQFKNIANLMPLVSELSSEIEAVQSGNRRIDRGSLRFTVNKLQIARGQTVSDFGDKLPGDVSLLLDELDLLEKDIYPYYAAGAEISPTAAILLRNRVSYIYSELRDYVLRINNDSLSVLERQGGEIGVLRLVNVLSALVYFLGALFCAFLLLSRGKILVELEKSRQVALKSSAAKSEFLSNMSHEIRTPMNAIIGLSYLALRTPLTPGQRDYVKRIQSSGQHLLGIINDILDFSKIEAGKLSMESIPFELEKVLDNVANLIAEKAATKGLELIFDIGKDVPRHLTGDPLRLGQVLVNLANNAVKFTDSGEVGIRTRIQEQAEGEVLLRFEVSDTGVGITEEQRKRLFASFQQADSSITRRYGGTGLGLAISKSLSEMMGGGISVESEPGKGSTFAFTARFDTRGEPEREYLPAPDLRGRRVLVVDDNEHAREVIADILAGMSFEPALAASGPEAIEEIAEAAGEGRPYHLVLVDWQMPEMDGLETSQRIKGLGLPEEPGIILITAYGREEVIKAAEERGIGDVLIKPLSPSLLFDAAMHLLRAERRSSPGRSAAQSTESGIQAGIEGVRILLVEDNEDNRQVALEILRTAGSFVDMAQDGREAVRKVKEMPYDLVLMDIQMPVMDGLSATREIRADSRLAKLPIVAMTANAMKEDRVRCMEAGMDDYVTKPIDPDALFATIRRYAKAERNQGRDRAPRPDAGARIPDIEGIDVAAGIKRVMGNAGLYADLLKRFSEGQRGVPARIRQAALSGDLALAERLAHTLKGVAGNIGAAEVQEAAGAVEAAFAGAASAQAGVELADRLEAPLSDAIRRIDETLDTLQASPSPDRPPAAKGNPIGEITEKLAVFIQGSEVEALDFFESERSGLEAAFGPGETARLGNALRSYDFKGAGSILAGLRGNPTERRADGKEGMA